MQEFERSVDSTKMTQNDNSLVLLLTLSSRDVGVKVMQDLETLLSELQLGVVMFREVESKIWGSIFFREKENKKRLCTLLEKSCEYLQDSNKILDYSIVVE